MTSFDPNKHPRGNQTNGHGGQFAAKQQSAAEVPDLNSDEYLLTDAEDRLNETLRPMLEALDIPDDEVRLRMEQAPPQDGRRQIVVRADWKPLPPYPDPMSLAARVVHAEMLKGVLQRAFQRP